MDYEISNSINMNEEFTMTNKLLCEKLKELYKIIKDDIRYENIDDFFKKYKIRVYKLDENLYYLNTEKHKSLVITNEFEIISNNFYDIIQYSVIVNGSLIL